MTQKFLNFYVADINLEDVIMKLKKFDNFFGKRSSKTDLAGQFIIGTILLSTIMALFAFQPNSLYINPYVYINPEPNFNTDNLRLKSIGPMQIKGTPKLGFNTLEVSWPVWSDCGPVYIEIIQYNMFRKEIQIWIWGRSVYCPQVVAGETHRIELFILIPGSWEILCNGKSIFISL